MKLFKLFPAVGITITLAAYSIVSNLQITQVLAQGIRGNYSFSSYNFPDRYIRHRNYLGYIEPVNDELGRKDATFRLRNGLANSKCTSFESINFPGHFLRHQDFRLKLARNDGSRLFQQDATFCQRAGVAGTGTSFESYNFPAHYIRHKNFELWIDPADGSDLFRKDATFIPQSALY
ncbi:AbfB domain-containing protein [Nostoc sp. TCL26-01]|uniref:AbfB domain-containing protein n=1 Tax=Nostoc sp. TCL26-01 TaxID=2576904 RepID=UPI0015BB89E3|nr:AbfB domain-containing protein [Nostoc sp. TCL26-01]QLE54941.1 arabinofuranosidase [Nostoc sp. TCL26-01]